MMREYTMFAEVYLKGCQGCNHYQGGDPDSLGSILCKCWELAQEVECELEYTECGNLSRTAPSYFGIQCSFREEQR